MSAMAQMSRAIRIVLEEHSSDGKLSGLEPETLSQFVQIVGAFYYDLKDEQAKRVEGK